MLKKRICTECGRKIRSSDIKDGLAREVNNKLYCRTCLLDLGLLSKRSSETDSFLDEVRNVLGEVELSSNETLMVERKTRVQVKNLLEKIIKTIEQHPSWNREAIIEYIRQLN